MIHPAAGGASRTIVVSGASETSVNHGKVKGHTVLTDMTFLHLWLC